MPTDYSEPISREGRSDPMEQSGFVSSTILFMGMMIAAIVLVLV